MSKPPPDPQPACARVMGTALAAVALGLAFPTFARTPTVATQNPPAAASAPAATPTPVERLKQLVPEQIGAWKRHSLAGPPLGREGDGTPSANAEFRNRKLRVTVSVSDAGAPTSAGPAAPVETKTDSGSEKTYREGTSTVRETYRRIDRQGEVTLLRADGIVVIARGTGIEAAQLKALASGVRPAETRPGPR